MTSSTPLSTFCQWLLNESDGKNPPCAIILHGDPSLASDDLVSDIARYLNEYDDEADGHWLNGTRELILKASADPSSRRLLGLGDLANPEDAESPDEFLRTLQTLGKRGHLVLQAPTEVPGALEFGRAFHAGIGSGDAIRTPCHLILNPELVRLKCIPQIIADVFLEWTSCESREDGSIRSLR